MPAPLLPSSIAPLVNALAVPAYWTVTEFATVDLTGTIAACSAEAARRGWSDDENYRLFVNAQLAAARTTWETSGLTAASGCSARYEDRTGTSLGAGVTTIVNFSTKIFDTDNAVAVGASWKFTVPAGKGGKYLVTASIQIVTTGGNDLFVFVNGVENTLLGEITLSATNTVVGGAAIVSLNAGDTVDIRRFGAGAVSVSTTAGHSHVEIAKIG